MNRAQKAKLIAHGAVALGSALAGWSIFKGARLGGAIGAALLGVVAHDALDAPIANELLKRRIV